MNQSDQQPLNGTRIGIFLAPEGTEGIEFTEPKRAVREAGGEIEVLSTETGTFAR